MAGIPYSRSSTSSFICSTGAPRAYLIIRHLLVRYVYSKPIPWMSNPNYPQLYPRIRPNAKIFHRRWWPPLRERCGWTRRRLFLRRGRLGVPCRRVDYFSRSRCTPRRRGWGGHRCLLFGMIGWVLRSKCSLVDGECSMWMWALIQSKLLFLVRLSDLLMVVMSFLAFITIIAVALCNPSPSSSTNK